MSDSPPKTTLMARFYQWLHHSPESRNDLVTFFQMAYEQNLIDSDALRMLEGVLSVAELQVRDVMIPRAQMDVIDIRHSPKEFIPTVIETAHSRFPVIEQSKDNVLGIMLAKDLLRFYSHETFNLRDNLRPAIFIPEAKRLNVLLREFQKNRNHMAIVVDEYGGVSGLVTIEDVLEQIVGEIEDEYDFDETEDNIILEATDTYRIKALTPLSEIRERLAINLTMDSVDTLGGYVIKLLGHLPKRHENVSSESWNFQVLKADSRRIYSILVKRTPTTPSPKP